MSYEYSEIIEILNNKKESKEIEKYNETKSKIVGLIFDNLPKDKKEEFINKANNKDYIDYYKNNFNELVNSSSEFINDNLKTSIENIYNNYYLKNEKEYEKILSYNDKINEIKNNVKDEKTLAELDYINKEILSEYDSQKLGDIANLAEKVARERNFDASKNSIEEANKNEILKDSFEIVINTLGKNENNKQIDTKEYKDEVRNLKIGFSNETKAILKEALTFLDSLKDFEGNSLLDVKKYQKEEQTKIYAFKNLDESKKLAQEIIESNDENKVEKLLKVSKFQKESLENYDKLIKIVNKLDIDCFPANISVSRNGSMPLKYINNFEDVSNVNSLWHVLAKIKKENISIDEYLENPIKPFLKSTDKYKDFMEVNKLGNSSGDLEFLSMMKDGLSNKKYSNLFKNVMNETNEIRYLLSTASFDKENFKHNRMTAQMFNSIYGSDIRKDYSDFPKNYLADHEIETFKNILICNDDVKDYARLSSSSKCEKSLMTGNEIKKFDYSKELNSDNLDYDKLLTKLTNYKNEINNNSNLSNIKNGINEAIVGISKDLIATKKLENSAKFDEFLKLSNQTLKDVYNTRRGKESMSKFILNQYNDINKTGFDKNRLNEMVNGLKGLSEKYNSRNIFSKYLTREGNRERHALENIKNDLIDNGINKTDLENVLKGVEKNSKIVEFKSETKHIGEPITVVEAKNNDKKIIDKSSKQLSKTLNIEQERSMK